MVVDGKKKGGAYERKVARELSEWMFNDCDMLKRHPTSGADKCIWNGDIVPMKQLPDSWEKHFPFIIECKTGYEQFYPTFWNYNKVSDWFNKSYTESLQHNQNNILLVCQFKNRSSLLITNICINPTILLCKVIIPIIINENIMWTYVYDYKSVLSLNFINVFNRS